MNPLNQALLIPRPSQMLPRKLMQQSDRPDLGLHDNLQQPTRIHPSVMSPEP